PELPVALLLRHPDLLQRLHDAGVGADVGHGAGASVVGTGVGTGVVVGLGSGSGSGTGGRTLARSRSVMAIASASDRALMVRSTAARWYEGRSASRMKVSFISVDREIGPRFCCTPR